MKLTNFVADRFYTCFRWSYRFDEETYLGLHAALETDQDLDLSDVQNELCTIWQIVYLESYEMK